VICGFGRLGNWFAIERFGIRPDMVVFAKAITSGYQPLGGVVVAGHVAAPFLDEPGRCCATGRPTPGTPPPAPRAATIALMEAGRACSSGPRRWRIRCWTGSRRWPTIRWCTRCAGGVGFLAGVELDPERLAAEPGCPGRLAGAVPRARVLIRPMVSSIGLLAAAHRHRGAPGTCSSRPLPPPWMRSTSGLLPSPIGVPDRRPRSPSPIGRRCTVCAVGHGYRSLPAPTVGLHFIYSMEEPEENTWPPEQRRARHRRDVRDFVDREVRPVGRELEHANEYPEKLIEQMKRMGIFGWPSRSVGRTRQSHALHTRWSPPNWRGAG